MREGVKDGEKDIKDMSQSDSNFTNVADQKGEKASAHLSKIINDTSYPVSQQCLGHPSFHNS